MKLLSLVSLVLVLTACGGKANLSESAEPQHLDGRYDILEPYSSSYLPGRVTGRFEIYRPTVQVTATEINYAAPVQSGCEAFDHKMARYYVELTFDGTGLVSDLSAWPETPAESERQPVAFNAGVYTMAGIPDFEIMLAPRTTAYEPGTEYLVRWAGTTCLSRMAVTSW